MAYLNWQGETVDEISESDYPTYRDYLAEKKRLSVEYSMAGMSGAYWSQRCCKNWKEESI